MRIITQIDQYTQLYATFHDQKIGFIPTMGYLHEGHMSLVNEAKKEADIVVLSIFVNPLQFGVDEDFSTYPRDLEKDARLAEAAGVDVLFVPDVKEMYPKPIQTTVKVSGITEILCGASRPGHFDGVATVVLKLFHIIRPDYAYFGLKDAQQVAIVTLMVQDLNVPVHIRACPTLREPDGLAMSSRNVYLNEQQRKEARLLYQTLTRAREQIRDGVPHAKQLIEEMTDQLTSSSLIQPDYVEIRSYPDFTLIKELKGKIIIALAVKIGKTRLIDNMLLDVEAERRLTHV